jgi:hypothetical protein
VSTFREDVLAAWIHDTKHKYLLDRDSIADSVDSVISVVQAHVAQAIAEAREEFIRNGYEKDGAWDRGFLEGMQFSESLVTGKKAVPHKNETSTPTTV